MHTAHTDSVSPASAIAYVNKLVSASRPFIRINSADRFDWRRVIKDPKDKRNGPWRYRAVFDVLDDEKWSRQGEVLYFVVDASNQVRLVGQSKKRLKDRWRISPMYDINTQAPLDMHSLFHTSAWPAIEAGFGKGDSANFTIRAIFRADLEKECLAIGGPLLPLLEKPETDLKRLSYHVEQWVCSLSKQGLNLWNQTGTKGKTTK